MVPEIFVCAPVVAAITDDGVENLSIDCTNVVAQGCIAFVNATNSWVQNVRVINPSNKGILMYQSMHITVRDSYLYGTQNAASESYGTDNGFSSADNLEENNIFQHIATPMMNEGEVCSVMAYNFLVDDFYNNNAPDWQQASEYDHAAGNQFLLNEGNEGIAATGDDIHGTADFITYFRNYWHGQDPNGGSTGGKSQQTNAIQIEAYSRFYNIVGNVLGTAGYHNNYEVMPTSATDLGDATTSNLSIYSFAYSGNQGTYGSPICLDPPTCTQYHSIDNDTVAYGTHMRWGNYDTRTLVTGCASDCVNGVRFVSSEVPSGRSLGDPQYGNFVPPTQSLAASWFHSSQPTSWWSTPWGTPPWPPIGPDVVNGSAYGMGANVLVSGFANDIPAAFCWFNTPIDSTYTTGSQTQAMNLTLTQSNTTVTATSNSPLPSSFSSTWPVNISGASVAGYNKNWRITSVVSQLILCNGAPCRG